MWLTRSLGLDDSRVVLIYIGDDVTDEDAFKVLRERPLALGIRVGEPIAEISASHYLRDCGEVKQFLESLLDLLNQRS